MTGIDMSNAAVPFGRPIAGILGRNICSSAIVEFDGPARTLRLHDRNAPVRVESSEWVPIELHRGLPRVRGAYAGTAEGEFVVDTGANTAVHFLGPAVRRHALLDSSSVEITGRKTQVTFGSSDRVDHGTIKDFRIGGRQFGPLSATFGSPGDGPSKVLPEWDGLVGMGLMGTLRVVLDEPGGRIAFIRSASSDRPTSSP